MPYTENILWMGPIGRSEYFVLLWVHTFRTSKNKTFHRGLILKVCKAPTCVAYREKLAISHKLTLVSAVGTLQLFLNWKCVVHVPLALRNATYLVKSSQIQSRESRFQPRESDVSRDCVFLEMKHCSTSANARNS
jgi:hypothetical protein